MELVYMDYDAITPLRTKVPETMLPSNIHSRQWCD
jgi:hypothetical protein